MYITTVIHTCSLKIDLAYIYLEDNGNDQVEGSTNDTPDNQNENQASQSGNGDSEHGNGTSVEPEQSMETDEKEEKKDFGERDLFKLMVVNSYGSQEIKKLVDDPKRTLSMSGMRPHPVD